MATANDSPSRPPKPDLMMPIAAAMRSSSGPPLLPGLIAASVWIIVAPSTSRRPLTMPRLTLFCRKPSGVPMVITSWPTRAVTTVPIGIVT